MKGRRTENSKNITQIMKKVAIAKTTVRIRDKGYNRIAYIVAHITLNEVSLSFEGETKSKNLRKFISLN